MSSDGQQPFVSVIVPVYNGAASVGKTIEALLAQDYPKDCYEILIVDNGSTDDTCRVVGQYPVQLLVEDVVRTSYGARNKGILAARGTIIAFTDADTVPTQTWITSGVRAMQAMQAPMLGGKVTFTFSSSKTPAEYVDSLINLNNEISVIKNGSAKTANLFVRKDLFQKVGMFHAEQASGEDAAWTMRASRAGNVIVYGKDAIVMHQARGFSELMKKHVRVGTGSIAVWRSQGRSTFWIVARCFSLLLPLLAFRIPGLIEVYGQKGVRYPLIRMMAVAWLCTLATAYGIVTA